MKHSIMSPWKSSFLTFALATGGLSVDISVADAQFTTYDNPSAGNGSGQGTYFQGISNGRILGGYLDNSGNRHSFILDGVTPTNIDDPQAVTSTTGTLAAGISGTTVVGHYDNGGGDANVQGFVLDLNTMQFTRYNHSGSSLTNLLGVSGATITGDWNAPGTGGSFTLGTMTQTEQQFSYPNGFGSPGPNYPSGYETKPLGISGSDIVGAILGPAASTNYDQGFYWNGSAFEILDDPEASSAVFAGTDANGISGSTIVGSFIGLDGLPHGFLFDTVSQTWTNIDDPLGPKGTVFDGIDGSEAVGGYTDAIGVTHAFTYVIHGVPEPGVNTLLAALVVVSATFTRRRRMNSQMCPKS